MRTGLFGGTFDPVHLGHLLLAETAREACALDRVVFVPAGRPPHKIDRTGADCADRFHMLEQALAPYDTLDVSRFELDSPDVSYTIHTVRHFREIYPEDEFFLIVGSETLADIPHWYESAQLCRLISMIVAPRPNCPEPDFGIFARFVGEETLDQWRRQVLPMPQIELSSTEIRARVASGKSIRFRVPARVEEYIAEQKLYR